jgi:hypothetical protein
VEADGSREYLYVHNESWSWRGDDDGRDDWEAHPILKRTPRRVYVSSIGCPVEHLGTGRERWYFDSPGPAIVLDRAELERRGCASSSRHVPRWHGVRWFYLRPDPSPPAPDRVRDALEVLGLSHPCTADELKAAYRRLSMETHPDRGGSAEAFRRIDEAYDIIDMFMSR